MLHHYVMYVGRRCFPNRKVYPDGYPKLYRSFDNSLEDIGIRGKKEILSLGYMCVEDNGNVFDCGSGYNDGKLICVGKQNTFSEDKSSYVNIDARDTLSLVEAAKKQLTIEEQLIYGELCIRDDMDLNSFIGYDKLEEWFSGLGNGKYSTKRLRPLNGYTDFEFCGYEIMCSECALSALTGFEDMTQFHENRLNQFGLFDSFENAVQMRAKLEKAKIDEDLVGTMIYGVWRYIK